MEKHFQKVKNMNVQVVHRKRKPVRKLNLDKYFAEKDGTNVSKLDTIREDSE